MTRSFTVNFDYRCPYGRIVHDHLVTGLRGGADWDVTFTPFCLGQAHVEEGESDIWDRPEDDSGIEALQAAIAVRDTQPDFFVPVHHALHEYRHTQNGNLRLRESLNAVIAPCGVDIDAMWAEVASGRPLATIKTEHMGFAASHSVWGVPTFIVGDNAVFVRLLDRPLGDVGFAIATINRVLDNIEWSILNEFKHTLIPR
ncbi:MAG: thioredoxin domain-containing protein [Ilumatobacteraceae bacterium]